MTNTAIRFARKQKQDLIDQYLAETGANKLNPSGFLDYIEARDDHPLHGWLFGQDDGYHARQHRLDLIRNFVGGLRTTITIQVNAPQVVVQETRQVNVTAVTSEPIAATELRLAVPSYVSPVADRKNGGGYIAFNYAEPDHRSEMARQALADLERWLSRYEGFAQSIGVGTDHIQAIVVEMRVIAGTDTPNLVAG